MPDPGDIIGQSFVNVRTCEQSNRPCMDDYPENVCLCPGCQGDGTYNAEQVAMVERLGCEDCKPLWRPVENGDTDDVG